MLILPLVSLLGGGAVTKVDPDSAGVNPAWRNALIHTVFGEIWPDGASLETIVAAQRSVREGVRVLEKLAPDSGAYFNEVK